MTTSTKPVNLMDFVKTPEERLAYLVACYDEGGRPLFENAVMEIAIEIRREWELDQ